MKKNYLMLFLVIFIFNFTGNSRAESVNGCHCFKDMAYKPEDRFAADDYILATSFNSLIASHYNIAKRQIVLLKMKGGVSQADLLVGLRIFETSGVSLERILAMKKEGKSWQKVMQNSLISGAIKKDNLLQGIFSGKTGDATAAANMADSLLADFYGEDLGQVVKLRSSGLNEKEIALVLILARTKAINIFDLKDQYIKKGMSWSEIAAGLGIVPTQAGKLILNYKR